MDSKKEKIFSKNNIKDIDKNKKKVYSLISYVYILWLVGLLMDREDEDVKFHVNQGIILSIFVFSFLIILKILSSILFAIAPVLTFITSLLQIVLIILSIIFMTMGIINVIKGEKRPLPFIGELFILF